MPVSLWFSDPNQDDPVAGGEVAANQAWFRFRRWAMMKSGLSALAQFAEHGSSNRLDEILGQLKSAAKDAPDEDLQETARVLLDALAERPEATDAVGISL